MCDTFERKENSKYALNVFFVLVAEKKCAFVKLVLYLYAQGMITLISVTNVKLVRNTIHMHKRKIP